MQIIVKGREKTKAAINAVALRTRRPTPAWPKVGVVMNKAVAKQFATKGAYFGTPWKPLTPRYLSWKLAHGFPRDILIMTGQMRGTLVSRPMNIEEYMGNRAVFGTSNQKAIWHHHGTRYRGQQVNPPRPILKATQPLAEDVADVLAEYIMGRDK